jgi:2-C-methyl-D-erythritol 4-phosphate cytidylyltransferase
MGSDRNKLLLPLLGKPVLAWTLMAARSARSLRWIGVIGQPDDFADFKEIVTSLGMSKLVHFIPGGTTRQESVHKGLQGLPAVAERVLIHDGARCLATPALLDRCAAELQQCPGLVAAVPVKDTIKVVDSTTQLVTRTPDRRQLWAAQTPQGFEVERLMQCHATGIRQGWEVTDDAALFEQCGLAVKIVQGEETNLKVTTPGDLAIAAFILRQREQLGD